MIQAYRGLEGGQGADLSRTLGLALRNFIRLLLPFRSDGQDQPTQERPLGFVFVMHRRRRQGRHDCPSNPVGVSISSSYRRVRPALYEAPHGVRYPAVGMEDLRRAKAALDDLERKFKATEAAVEELCERL